MIQGKQGNRVNKALWIVLMSEMPFLSPTLSSSTETLRLDTDQGGVSAFSSMAAYSGSQAL